MNESGSEFIQIMMADTPTKIAYTEINVTSDIYI